MGVEKHGFCCNECGEPFEIGDDVVTAPVDGLIVNMHSECFHEYDDLAGESTLVPSGDYSYSVWK